MNRIVSRRMLAALGISVAVAIAAGAQPGVAQPAPRTLPANPQFQDRGPDRQQDPQFDRRDDRQYGDQYDRRGGYDDRGGRLEERLAFLHRELRITPAQERTWNVLADAVRGDARERDRNRPEDRRYIRAPSVVDRLEERERMLADRSAGLDRIIRALRPLYASFNEDQRRTADQLMFQPGAGRFGGRGGPGFRGAGRAGPEFDQGFGRGLGYDRGGRFGDRNPEYR